MNVTHTNRPPAAEQVRAPGGGAPDRRWLGIYLNDHLAGATAGLALCRRAERVHRGDPLGPDLRRLALEIAEDRRSLLDAIRRLGLPVRRHKAAAGWLGEKAGRLKPNGRLLKRSPLSDVLELEALGVGIQGKAMLWRTLLRLDGGRPAPSGPAPLDHGRLERLAERAARQAGEVDALRSTVALEVLGPPRS
ncbi:hypothetical protein ACFVVL_01455 [Kitasatospora sp. NPDC058115]|uniref:hypothetical protein n=1 Tax=Kitasatospora sp. NPDC058115 TaxID=3346347 RepID=UPI0036DB102B